MKKMKKVMALSLCAAMTAGLLTGCGNAASNGGGKGDEPITLTVFSQLANYSGEQSGWSADILLDKFNVKLNIVPDLNGTYPVWRRATSVTSLCSEATETLI